MAMSRKLTFYDTLYEQMSEAAFQPILQLGFNKAALSHRLTPAGDSGSGERDSEQITSSLVRLSTYQDFG